MNYCLLGLGFIGKRHKKSIEEIGGKVIMTIDIDPLKNADFTDYREAFSSPKMKEVDVINILTPNYLHAEHIRAAKKTGKFIICEKPLTIFNEYDFLDGVYVVHQLHFHKRFDEICQAIKSAKKIKVSMRAYRDENFWKSWKGEESKSGGVIYILGSHIFDLLLSALPNSTYELKDINDTNKKSTGKIIFNTGQEVEFINEFLDSRDGQDRYVECDGVKYQLSQSDNLSFDGMHTPMLKAFENGISSNVKEAIKYVKLIDNIKKFKNL